MTKLDVVVFGATGFTGRLTAIYLAERCRDGLNLAFGIAGRDGARLKSIQAELHQIWPATKVPIIEANAVTGAGLEDMVAHTKVVLSTVGPYLLYGERVVAACAQSGTHYVDLTGEGLFIRKCIDDYGAEAVRTGAKIVNCCGFDCIPTDIAVHLMAKHMRETHKQGLSATKMIVGRTKGGVSGGTLHSAFNMMEQPRDVLRRSANPYFLTDYQHKAPRTGTGFGFDSDLGQYTAPWVMAKIDVPLVYRSASLAKHTAGDYGESFVYQEAMGTGTGLRGLATSVFVTLGLAIFMLLAFFRPTRWLLRRVLPAPGQGPSEKTMREGFFNMHFFARGDDASNPRLVRASVTGNMDGGYALTARMIAESAVLLAKEEDRLIAGGGIFTPASVFGEEIAKRLAPAGLEFKVTDH